MTTETKVLNPKVESFCVFYTTIGEPTFAHAGKSAIAAGYSEASARNTATDLLKKPDVQQRIRELHTANMTRNNITVDKVLADLEQEKGDIASAVRADEIQGKWLAMWIDRQEITEPERRQMDEHEAEEIRVLAALRLRSKYNLPEREHIHTPILAATTEKKVG
jgi:phage terminase small subunit